MHVSIPYSIKFCQIMLNKGTSPITMKKFTRSGPDLEAKHVFAFATWQLSLY